MISIPSFFNNNKGITFMISKIDIICMVLDNL